MYLIITHASGYIEEKRVNKYLIFDSTDEKKELKNTMMFLMMYLKNTVTFLMELETNSKK